MNTIRCVLSRQWLYIVSSHKWPRLRKFRCRGNRCKWRCAGGCVDSAPWGLEDLWPQAGASPVIHLHFWHVSSHMTGTRLVKSRRLARRIQKIQIDEKRQDCSTWICIIIVTWQGPVSSGIYSKVGICLQTFANLFLWKAMPNTVVQLLFSFIKGFFFTA